jgi:ribosome-associated protein
VNKKQEKTVNLSDVIVLGMKEKKASDITIINLKSIKNAVADYFILCTGNSDTQVDAISDAIETEVYKYMEQNPWHKEGQQNKEWILIDYIDVVAHVFKKDRRKHFALEELWGDAKITNISYETA